MLSSCSTIFPITQHLVPLSWSYVTRSSSINQSNQTLDSSNNDRNLTRKIVLLGNRIEIDRELYSERSH